MLAAARAFTTAREQLAKLVKPLIADTPECIRSLPVVLRAVANSGSETCLFSATELGLATRRFDPETRAWTPWTFYEDHDFSVAFPIFIGVGVERADYLHPRYRLFRAHPDIGGFATPVIQGETFYTLVEPCPVQRFFLRAAQAREPDGWRLFGADGPILLTVLPADAPPKTIPPRNLLEFVKGPAGGTVLNHGSPYSETEAPNRLLLFGRSGAVQDATGAEVSLLAVTATPSDASDDLPSVWCRLYTSEAGEWVWHKLPSVPGATHLRTPVAVIYQRKRIRCLRVFVVGLVKGRWELFSMERHDDGYWRSDRDEIDEWNAHGTPPGVAEGFEMTTRAVLPRGPSVRDEVALFGQTDSRNAIVYFKYDGVSWEYGPLHGPPPGSEEVAFTVAEAIYAIHPTWPHDIPARLSVFLRNERGELWERYFDLAVGSFWGWLLH